MDDIQEVARAHSVHDGPHLEKVSGSWHCDYLFALTTEEATIHLAAVYPEGEGGHGPNE